MSHVRIQRYTRYVAVVASTATSEATTIRLDDMAGATVAVAGASTNATRLAVFGSPDDVTYRPVYGSGGAAAEVVLSRLTGTAVIGEEPATTTITVYTSVAATYTLPDAAYGLRYMRLVPDADLGTAASVTVVCKS